MKIKLLIFSILVLSFSLALAEDWSSCSSDLDYLRRRADDARSAAEDADSKQRTYKQSEDDYQNCRRYPQMYDLLKDGCRYKRTEFESARNYYRNELSNLQSKLQDVESKVRAVNNSCGVELSRVSSPPPSIPDGIVDRDYCALTLRYKGQLPTTTLVEICSKNRPLNECKKCLGLP